MNGVFLFLITTASASSSSHSTIHLISTLRLTHSSILLSHPLSHSITPFNTQHISPLFYPHTQQDTSVYPCLFWFTILPLYCLTTIGTSYSTLLLKQTTHPLLITLLLHPIRPFLSTITLPSTYTLSTTSLNPFLSLLHFSFYQWTALIRSLQPIFSH